jgi:hypothetical protein
MFRLKTDQPEPRHKSHHLHYSTSVHFAPCVSAHKAKYLWGEPGVCSDSCGEMRWLPNLDVSRDAALTKLRCERVLGRPVQIYGAASLARTAWHSERTRFQRCTNVEDAVFQTQISCYAKHWLAYGIFRAMSASAQRVSRTKWKIA